MLQRIMICLIAIVAAATAADARRRHPIDATPFSHAPCSVLSRAAVHAVVLQRVQSRAVHSRDRLSHGENLQLTIETVPPRDDAAKYQKPDHDLDTIGDLFAALRSCWSPPPADSAREGMQMSVRFSFKRSGEIIAAPRVTFATVGAPAEVRDTYFRAISTSLDACMPLKFTGGLGGALAGRPIAIRYVDNRELDKPRGRRDTCRSFPDGRL